MSELPAEQKKGHGAGRRSRMARFAVPLGVALGCTAYFVIVRMTGVVIEQWEGINTFTNPAWFAAVAVAPVVSGFITGVVAGHNGKWLGMLPVALIHPADYAHAAGTNPGNVLGFGIFVFLMLVMLELALMAGWGAEILRNRMAGREVRA